MNKVLRAHLALSLSAFLVTPAFARTYTVKSGDTLSGITHREVGGPVWGENGTLEKIKRLNPQVKDANRIYPKDIIHLSDEEAVAEAPVEPLPTEPEPQPESPVAEESEVAPADSGEAVKRKIPPTAIVCAFLVRCPIQSSKEKRRTATSKQIWIPTLIPVARFSMGIM